MIAGKSILGIIPTRLGSKRLKNKNIREFKKKPLFIWSYLSAKKSKYIDKILISTESKKVINFAKPYGKVIDNMPVIEPIVTDNEIMTYFLFKDGIEFTTEPEVADSNPPYSNFSMKVRPEKKEKKGKKGKSPFSLFKGGYQF